MKGYCFSSNDFIKTNWGGGITSQIAIFPENTSCKTQDFIWRVSSASVEEKETDFTIYPRYYRLIGPLDESLELQHENGEKTVLYPGDIYAFDGNEKIHSRGICRDINVMFRKDSAEGTLQFLELAVGSELRISAPLLPTVALSDCFMGVYCFSGTCSVEYSGDESKKLSEGTFLLLNEVGNEYLKICAEKSQARLYIISIRNKAKARR